MLSIQVKKAGRAFDVPALVKGEDGAWRVEGIADEGVLYIWEYGFKQSLGDATVQAEKLAKGEADPAKLEAHRAECESFAVKRLANILAGTKATRTVKPADRIEAEALRMATAMVKAHPKLQGASAAKIKEMAAKYAPSYRDRAKAAIAELDAINADIEVDLD